MRHRIATLILGVALGLSVASVQAPISWEAFAAPPGSTTTIEVTDQLDKDYLLRHELIEQELAQMNASIVHYNELITNLTVRRNALSAKIRAALVAHKSGLESLLPATTTHYAIGWDDVAEDGQRKAGEDDAIWLYVNQDAIDNRASPPAGVAFGPVVGP